MKEIPYDHECGARSNYEHLNHVFEGYRAFVIESIEANCPHSPGSAQRFSWELGFRLAQEEAGTG